MKSLINLMVVLIAFCYPAESRAFTEIIRSEGTYTFPHMLQDASALRLDTILLALEEIADPQQVWFKFGYSLYLAGPGLHPKCATYQDSIEIFLFNY